MGENDKLVQVNGAMTTVCFLFVHSSQQVNKKNRGSRAILLLSPWMKAECKCNTIVQLKVAMLRLFYRHCLGIASRSIIALYKTSCTPMETLVALSAN